jgi:hypothetical protein
MTSPSDEESSLPSPPLQSSPDTDRELYRRAVENIFSVREDLTAATRNFRAFIYWLDRYFDAWVRAAPFYERGASNSP